MVWVNDKAQKQVSEAERTKLLLQREKLVEQLKDMQKKNGTHRYAHQVKMHQEDMAALAKKIGNIDKKLGRA